VSDDIRAGSTRIEGADGDEIEAYLAAPVDGGTGGSVVVIHHMPGYDAATKEIVRRFAVMRYTALCPNLYWREAPGAEPDDAAATARAGGGVPDARLVGDVAGAAAHLRALPSSNGRVGVIGFCSGGRQSVLAACSTDLDAAVDCYGAFVVGAPPPAAFPQMSLLYDLLPDLRAPLLGLFGRDDARPSPDHVAELDGLLERAGKAHEFHSYEDTGHDFFAVDRPSYRPAAAVDGWSRIGAFFAEHLTN